MLRQVRRFGPIYRFRCCGRFGSSPGYTDTGVAAGYGLRPDKQIHVLRQDRDYVWLRTVYRLRTYRLGYGLAVRVTDTWPILLRAGSCHIIPPLVVLQSGIYQHPQQTSVYQSLEAISLKLEIHFEIKKMLKRNKNTYGSTYIPRNIRHQIAVPENVSSLNVFVKKSPSTPDHITLKYNTTYVG